MSTHPIAVVTGAAGIMGSAVCRLLLEQSWQVLGIDRNTETLEMMSRDHSGFHPLHGNLEDPDLPQRAATLAAELGSVQGLVNLAGISEGTEIGRLDDDTWSHCFAINVDAPMRMIRALSTHMPEGSSIVNIGSPVGVVGARKPSYAASKSALQGLTMSCARNLGPRGIRVNLLLPGPTLTRMTEDWPREKQAAIAQGTFLNRLSKPEEVASVVAFMLSPGASYMTGSVVDLTAGSLWGH